MIGPSMRFLIIFAAFLILIPVCWVVANPLDSPLRESPPSKPSNYGQEALPLPSEMTEMIRKLFKMFEEDDLVAAHGYVLVAVLLTERGKPRSGIEYYNKAIKLNPKIFYAYCLRGLAYLNLRLYAPAKEDFSKFIELYPENYERFNKYWLGDEKEKELPPKIQRKHKLLMDQLIANAYLGRGVAYTQLGEYRPAIKDLKKAIQLDPRNADAYASLGVTHQSRGDYKSAIRNYEEAIQLNPQHPTAYYNLGWCYYLYNHPYLSVRSYLLGFLNDKDALQAIKSLSISDILTGRF